MKKIRNYGLTIALMVLFLFSAGGQLFTGFNSNNAERIHQGQPPLQSVWEYAKSPHFNSALFENWESEFLQMGVFVFLTMFLYQKGSSESKPPPDEEQEPIKYPHKRYFKHNFWARKLYEHSLCLTLFTLFVISFLLHGYGSMGQLSDENIHMGKPPLTFFEVFKEYEFWFESFQNWQSEFFSVAVLVVLSIFLRQKDSPQSKETDAPHQKTGH